MRKTVPLLAVSLVVLFLLVTCAWEGSASLKHSVQSLPLHLPLQQNGKALIDPPLVDTHYHRGTGTDHSFRFGLDPINVNMTGATSSTNFPAATSIEGRDINRVLAPNIGGWSSGTLSSCAPTLDQTVASDIFDSTACLYDGSTSIQVGVPPFTIKPKRVAVLRGKVLTRDQCPIGGVVIAVLNHEDEFGSTRTQADGTFTMVVNGGEQLTVTYSKPSVLPMQRTIQTAWREYAWLPDVVMTTLDSKITTINLATSDLTFARGSSISDADGTRTATLLVPPGTTAKLADGTAVTSFKVQATEYSVSAGGPAAMPAELPPTSGYTYAIDYTATDADGAVIDVQFNNKPVFHYVENFVQSLDGATGTLKKFAVGSPVPVGFYDKKKGQWVASKKDRLQESMLAQVKRSAVTNEELHKREEVWTKTIA